jgi:predicted nucleic acid-binding protein
VPATNLAARFPRISTAIHTLSIYNVMYLALAIDLRLPLACKDGPLRSALSAAGVKPA